MFRKPKKQISRRVFTRNSDDECEPEKMDTEPPLGKIHDRKKGKESDKKVDRSKFALLSFGDDEEEEGDVFQVKKSHHSKKVMKERRKKKKELESAQKDKINSNGTSKMSQNVINPETDTIKNEYSHNIQTEIHTDDFVLVVKNSQPDMILNDQAAFCSDKDGLSSDEENEKSGQHKFNQTDHFKLVLESGVIPDAAMIHAARKRRQKAREQGDFIPLEDIADEPNKSNRLLHESEPNSEEDERVDMSAITGLKEIEERKEKFYQAQQYSGDSDQEIHEWENQQIRKGVTGVQLGTAQQELIMSNIILQSSFVNSFNNSAQLTLKDQQESLTTADLLNQAYSYTNFCKPKSLKKSGADIKIGAPKTPNEILGKMMEKLEDTRESLTKNLKGIEQTSNEISTIRIEDEKSKEDGPKSAAKYRFYQDIKYYLLDLIECLDEKLPHISTLEQKALKLFEKFSNNLIERRRQDIRDQAKDITEALKPPSVRKSDPDDQAKIRRVAEREGRRTRRRRDREKNDINDVHFDGMSSDDEVNDHEVNQYKNVLQSIDLEVKNLLTDASDEFVQIGEILKKFESWKRKYPDTYNEAFVHLCIPKILGPLIRLKLVTWNPLREECIFEESQWYEECMKYGVAENETEESLAQDKDSVLVPTIIEKIILPKLNDFVQNVWDPLSTTQTFRLVKLISRLGREYPSIRPKSKTLRNLFAALLDKIKMSIENDVFIPIFPKQIQEGKSSFFQRQFYSGLKLFRNTLSWQGILADDALKELAILSLLNRYLLLAIRNCSPIDATNKCMAIVYTMPRVWLAPDSSVLNSLEMFAALLRHILSQFDKNNLLHKQSIESINNILKSLHIYH